jgi:4-amino-4-deoxy-L-arabinose transferase-like glycosyltransferase
MTSRTALQRARAFGPAAAIGGVFLILLAISWRRWTSPIADSGRELDLPLRLLAGEWLYRDVHYLYPPLSPYFNALLYRLFGARLEVLQAGGILCALLILWLCYRIARRLLAPGEAAFAMIAIVILCVFKPAGNLVWPYAFAALHATTIGLGALLFALRYASGGRRREIIFAGLLLGLAAITKQEFALASGAAIVSAALARSGIARRRAALDVAAAAGAALAILLPVYGWMFARFGWETLVVDGHLFFTHLPAPLVYYNARRLGFDRPLASLAQMAGGAAVGVLIAGAIAALALLRAGDGEARELLPRSLLWLAGALAVVLLVIRLAPGGWDGSPLRALPLLLIALIIIAWRRRGSGATVQAVLIIAVYSLTTLARVALRVPSGGAFGGFFLPTSLILVHHLFAHTLPRALDARAGEERVARSARTLWHILFGATLVVTAIIFGIRYRMLFNELVRAPRGSLYMPRATGQAYAEALDFIAAHTLPNEAIAVLPEGSDLAVLSARRSVLRHQILIPGLLSESDERAAIAALDPVRYIFIVNRPMREFGAEAFGRDFYHTLGGWIADHYRTVKVCGDPTRSDPQIGDPHFFIRILERK